MLKLNKVSFAINDNGNEVHLIKDASISIPPGKFMAIVGPSGCGKTTLLKIIAGINEESSGTITWGGRNLSEEDLAAAEVGYVPQFGIAFDELTIEESIGYALRLRVNQKQIAIQSDLVATIIEQVGLKELSDRRVKVLSGGQKRRLSLALELVTNPTLLLCDEVTSGLDPRSEKEIVNLLHSLSQNNERIVVNVTHSLNHLDLYDIILVLYEGRVAYQGPPDKITHYFSVESAEEIYPLLACRESHEWHNSWNKHKDTYLIEDEDTEYEIKSAQSKPSPSPVSQFYALISRRFKIFTRDKTQLILQAAMIIGFPLLVIVFGLDGITQPKTLSSNNTGSIIEQFNHQVSVSESQIKTGSLISGLIMFQVILLTLIASNNSAREIAGEREIFEKERFGGLNTASYIGSKIAFLTILVLIQSLWMGIFVQICIPTLPGSPLTRLLILFLVTAAMTSVCLGISGLMKNPEQSSLMSIYLVGFQLPLSGAILALPQWLEPFSQPFISAFWAWSANLDIMTGGYFGQSIHAVTEESSLQPLNICIAWLSVHILTGIFAAYAGTKRPQW
ncbi:MAG: ATP-binding cassette domain-containing protein [Verrucomicrobiales bacterium]|nr:ATP-binding cassette domain-containing protein [Verrucomicrobiales bacterium]